MPKQKIEQLHSPFPPEQAFHGVEWLDGQRPDQLRFDPHSRFTRDANSPDFLYAIRVSKHDVPLKSATPDMLFNGNASGEKWNATEGHGMYLTNAPRTDRVMGIRHDNKYVTRVKLAPEEILAAHESLDRLATGQKMAALLLRARGVIPGIPNPGPTNWDKLYGNAVAVSYPPTALARPFALNVAMGSETTVSQQWMVLRDPDPARIQVVGKYLPRVNK